MKNRTPLTLVFVLTVALALGLGPVAAPVHAAAGAAADKGKVSTRTTLLVGFPSAENPVEGVLVVPGTVIPNLGHGPSIRTPLSEEEARSQRLGRLTRELTSTFRLETVEASFSESHALGLEEPVELAPPAADLPLRITVELLGFDARTATYRVRFVDRNVVLADSRVAATRGRQTVIGGLNGDEAPYLFLVLEPAGASGSAESAPLQVGHDITAPRRMVTVPPRYTETGRKERVQGFVIVQAVIDKDGTVNDVKVLKGLPYGLTEAAVEAIRHWTFEPARDALGNPVAVYYNLTINFTLGDEKKDADEGTSTMPRESKTPDGGP